MMREELRGTMTRVNRRLSGLLQEVQRTLQDEGEFGVETVRSIGLPVEEMAPIVKRSAELLQLHPELSDELDFYKTQLREMQAALGQVKQMLLARQASLEAGRAQVSAVTQWISAFQQTR